MQTPWRTPGNPELANSIHLWMPSDTEANWICRGKPSRYDDTSFDYRYNEYGFRCDSMADPDQHPRRLLVVGDSVTEGIGLPMQATWGYHITEKLRHAVHDHSIPYWCVARGGVGIDYCARQLSVMLPILRPHAVVALLPDPSRRELWHQGQMRPWCPGDDDDQQWSRRIVDMWSDDQITHDSQRAVIMMSQACAAVGAAWHWHMAAYGPSGNKVYQRVRDGLPDSVQAQHFNSAPGGGDVARDGMHGGPGTHRDFVDALWTEIGTDLLANLR